MTRRYHHGDLRQAILDTTLGIIDSKGIEAVSLRAVARQLGVSEAAPYHHFGSKRDLLAVLAADAYRGFGAELDAAVAASGDDPYDRLHALAHAYVRYGLESRGRYRLLFGEHMVDLADDAEVRAAGQPTRRTLEDTVAACAGDWGGDVVAVENTVWALAHGITSLVGEAEIRSDRDDVDRLIDTAISVVVAGIRAQAASASQASGSSARRS